MRSRDSRRKTHADLEGPDPDELVDRGAPAAFVREVDQVKDQPVWLRVQVAIDQAGPVDGQRQVARGPPHDVREEACVIGQVLARVTPVQIRRHERDTRASVLRQHERGDVGLRLPHP